MTSFQRNLRAQRGRTVASSRPRTALRTAIPGAARTICGPYDALVWRRRRWLVLLAAAAMVGVSLATTVIFLGLLISVRATAFAVLYHASAAVTAGRSPYRNLSGIELNQAFEYLPWVAVALSPFTRLPFPIALHLWVALSGAVAVGSAWVLARALGWHRPWLLAASVAVWEVLWRGLLTGQVDGWLVGLETVCLLMVRKGRYGWAGAAAMTAALIKPQVMWILPVALLWPALERGRARRYMVGALGTGAVLVAGPSLLHPSLLAQWWASLGHFSTSIASIQPDLAGLPGLLRFAPVSWGLTPSLRDPATLFVVAAGLVWIVRLVLTRPSSGPLGVAEPRPHAEWLASLTLGAWVLVAPYSHSNDLLVLIPLLALVVGVDFEAAREWDVLGVLASMVVLPEFFLLLNPAQAIGQLSVASLAVAALVVVAYQRSPWRGGSGSPADPAPPKGFQPTSTGQAGGGR